MSRKKTVAFVLSLMVCRVAFGQDYHFSGFMQNLVYVNPAYVAMPSSGEVGLTYRNQWPGIPATFVTYGASLVMPVKMLSSGAGFQVTNDVQGGGVISRTTAGLIYGYLIELERNWQVGTGISASWVMKNLDADELVFRSDILNDLGYSYGTVTFDSYTKSYPDFSIGVIIRNSYFLSFGFSAAHVTRPYDANGELAESSRIPVKYTAFISGTIGDNRRRSAMSFEPAAFFSMQRDYQELIWGSWVNVTEAFRLGGWLRQNPKFNFDACIISAGFSWEKYNISYNYDVNLKKIHFLSTKMAAHEVTFLYRFEYKEKHKVKRFRKSECPAY